MLKDKCFLVSMLVLLMLTIGFASASQASDLYNASDNTLDSSLEVENSEDLSASDDGASFTQASDDGPLTATVKPSGKTFANIQTAVNNAKAGDVIELDGTYTSSGKTIAVKKSLTFNGVNGATLDAKKLSGIFHITKTVTVNFNNITFINAKDGAIFADSDGFYDKNIVKVNIDGCSFKDNYKDWRGAAIEGFTSGLLKITNSNFTNNYVAEPGKNVKYPDSYGGAISAENLEIVNCNFINNHAQRYAGAIAFEGSAKITDCFFKGNYANAGGAIDGGNLYMINTTFESNYLKSFWGLNSYYGGAVSAGSVNAIGCTFTSNSAGYNGGKGGAIYATDVEVTNCSFYRNTANLAGAIFVDNAVGEDDYELGSLKITQCNFTSNEESAVKSPKIILDNSKTFKNKALDNNMNAIALLKATSKKLVTTYYSGKTIKIKVVTPSGKPAVRVLLLAFAKSSKNKESIPIKTNSKGIATIKASKLNAGKYKITVYEAFCIPGADPGDEKYIKVPGVLTTTTLKVKKTKAIVKAPKVKFKYKKSKYFKVTLKHKSTKKPMSGIKLKLKIYTGKKYNTYNVKTNKKGVAKFNTKRLSYGKHKVKVMSGNKNVILSKKSVIRIR
ncbi:hypothetical protein [Methanobrevibacter sp.]|uniref:hypothetical protein n=2 Tax=Methanobrevibacter sp. TaxID=66852 RepID=UPI00386C17FF